MGEQLPFITMVKSKEICEPFFELTDSCQTLLATLSSLCSFYSVEDLVSFLFSQGFQDLNKGEEPWITFEIGIYQDHTKNIQLLMFSGNFLLIDDENIIWNDGVFESDDKNEISKEIKNWCVEVFNPKSRYQ